MLGASLAATFKSPGQIVLTVLTEEGVLRPLPQSKPDGVLQPLCYRPQEKTGTRNPVRRAQRTSTKRLKEMEDNK